MLEFVQDHWMALVALGLCIAGAVIALITHKWWIAGVFPALIVVIVGGAIIYVVVCLVLDIGNGGNPFR